MHRNGLRDDQWKQIKDLLTDRKVMRAARLRTTVCVEAVLHRDRVDIPWRDLPARFGNWKNVRWRLRRWYESSVIERIVRDLGSRS
ncbi:transposase [Acetobacter sicerae]|uniref:transposase n=1 Tax=Acetobacter sicerae TaxID=85325 RepID=UPI001F54CC13|nr:transposase [Acetobacter sicerae]